MRASSVARTFPDRWWAPDDRLLEQIVPGLADVKVMAVELERGETANGWDAKSIWLRVDERYGDEIGGVITRSELDRNSYREGQRMSAPIDRVFDMVLSDTEGNPLFNEARARFMLGKRVLVGLTTLSESEEVFSRRQFVGTVSEVDGNGIALELADGTTYWMPPDCSGIEEAQPAEYRLRDSGDVVVDPDYVCSWTLQPDDNGDA